MSKRSMTDDEISEDMKKAASEAASVAEVLSETFGTPRGVIIALLAHCALLGQARATMNAHDRKMIDMLVEQIKKSGDRTLALMESVLQGDSKEAPPN